MAPGARRAVLRTDAACNRGTSRLCRTANFLPASLDCVVPHRCFASNTIASEIEELPEVSDVSVFTICAGISGRALSYESSSIGRSSSRKYARVSLRNKRTNSSSFSNSEYESAPVHCIPTIKFIICCVRRSSSRDSRFVVVEPALGVATRPSIKRQRLTHPFAESVAYAP